MRSFLCHAVAVICILGLSACSLQRAQEAADAQKQMVGLSKEQMLACMGPPKQKALVGSTEVWSYASTSGNGNSYGNSHRSGTESFNFTTRDKSFCTVNVVMVNGFVNAVRYNGPRGGFLAPDAECAYAIEHCINGN